MVIRRYNDECHIKSQSNSQSNLQYTRKHWLEITLLIVHNSRYIRWNFMFSQLTINNTAHCSRESIWLINYCISLLIPTWIIASLHFLIIRLCPCSFHSLFSHKLQNGEIHQEPTSIRNVYIHRINGPILILHLCISDLLNVAMTVVHAALQRLGDWC